MITTQVRRGTSAVGKTQKERLGWVRFTQGGGLGGLGLGYYQAAPPGLRRTHEQRRFKGFARRGRITGCRQGKDRVPVSKRHHWPGLPELAD